MTDEEETEGAAASGGQAEQAEQAEQGKDSGEDNATDQDTEARARRQGWHGRESFNGPDDKFVDAETFLAKAESELPVLRERMRAVDKKVAEQDKAIKAFVAHNASVEARMYEKAKAEIRAEMREAVRDEDVERFDALEKKADELEKTAPKPPAKAEAEVPEEFVSWAEKNRWFKTDRVMTEFAITYHDVLLNEKPGMSVQENLSAVTKEVRKRFPEKFENARQGNAPAVEGVGGAKARTTGGKTYENLPPEAKKACDLFVKSMPGFTRAKYVQQYGWD